MKQGGLETKQGPVTLKNWSSRRRRWVGRTEPCKICLKGHCRNPGNQTMQQWMKGREVQAKVKVGERNDRFELEADRLADQVMRMSEPFCPGCPGTGEDEEMVRAAPVIQENFQVGSTAQGRIESLKGGGEPLPEIARSFFEPRFGYDFSGVRVHADSRAAELASSLGARAFTLGQDVVFAKGQYQPGSLEGKRLLAHELTHVVQQNPVVGLMRGVSPVEDRVQRAGFSSTIEICHRFLKSRDFSVSSGNVTVTCDTHWDPTGCSTRNHFNITLNKKQWPFDSELGSRRYPIGSSHSETWSELESGTYYLEIWFATNTNPHCCLKGTIDVVT